MLMNLDFGYCNSRILLRFLKGILNETFSRFSKSLSATLMGNSLSLLVSSLSSSSSSSSSSDHSDTEDKKINDHPKTKVEEIENDCETKKETSYENPSFDPRQFYNADDDAQVCTIVPIKDRKVIFEQLQSVRAGNNVEDEKTRGGKDKLLTNIF